MKAIFKYIFICLSFALGFSSCEKDAELPWPGDPDGAEKQVVGTYSGQWSRLNNATDVTESDSGSVIFTYDEELGNNVATIQCVSALNLGLKADACNVNVTKRANGTIIFWNAVATNPFGMKFTGEITTDNQIKMTYHAIVRSGRKEVEFDYSFEGVKDN